MNLVEYFDHQYKQYGLKLFQTLLKKGVSSTIIIKKLLRQINKNLINNLNYTSRKRVQLLSLTYMVLFMRN